MEDGRWDDGTMERPAFAARRIQVEESLGPINTVLFKIIPSKNLFLSIAARNL